MKESTHKSTSEASYPLKGDLRIFSSHLLQDHMGKSPQKYTSEGSNGRIPTKVQQKQAILLKEIREYSQKVYKMTIWENPPKSISEAILLKEI